MLAHIPELVNHVASFADVKDLGSFSLANKQFKDAVDDRVTDIRCYNDDALTAGAAERWKNVDSVTVATWSNIPSICNAFPATRKVDIRAPRNIYGTREDPLPFWLAPTPYCGTSEDLVPVLSRLTGLEHLHVQPEVCSMLLLDSGVTRLSALSKLTHLTFELVSEDSSSMQSSITDLSTNLSSLSIYTRRPMKFGGYIRWDNVDALDMEPLGALTNLSRLDLGLMNVVAATDLSPLRSLTRLTRLTLLGPGNRLVTLEPLRDMTLLSHLKMECLGSTEETLEPLRNLTQLTYLELVGFERVVDLEPLAGLGNLSCLCLENFYQVTSLEPLVALAPRLRHLRLKELERADLDPLSTLVGLTSMLPCWRCGQMW